MCWRESAQTARFLWWRASRELCSPLLPAAHWQWRVSCFRPSYGTPWPIHLPWACRLAVRSARSWRFGSDWKQRFGGFPGFLSPHSRERLSPFFSCFSSREPATHYRHFLLLAGITLNFVFGALIMFIHYAANFSQGYLMTRWTMGAVDTADMQTVARSAPFVIACFFGLLWLSPQLNPLTAGEEWAASRGVYVRRIKHLVYFIGSILTGTVTASSGPIGFVGLIVPHTVRLIGGPDHRTLIPASFFLGSAFLVLCDTLARTLFAPAEIPVGVITAILGGPFFILLLKRKRGELW